MLCGKSFPEKLKLMAQISAAFLSIFIFHIGSTSIVMICLHWIGLILYVAVSISSIIASNNMFGNRREIIRKLMTSLTIAWITNTLALTVLMIWSALDPSTYLSHWDWSDPRYFFHDNPPLFYATTSALLVLGPISLLLTWRLKHQFKAHAQKEGKMDILWGPGNTCDLKSIKPVTITIK